MGIANQVVDGARRAANVVLSDSAHPLHSLAVNHQTRWRHYIVAGALCLGHHVELALIWRGPYRRYSADRDELVRHHHELEPYLSEIDHAIANALAAARTSRWAPPLGTALRAIGVVIMTKLSVETSGATEGTLGALQDLLISCVPKADQVMKQQRRMERVLERGGQLPSRDDLRIRWTLTGMTVLCVVGAIALADPIVGGVAVVFAANASRLWTTHLGFTARMRWIVFGVWTGAIVVLGLLVEPLFWIVIPLMGLGEISSAHRGTSAA